MHMKQTFLNCAKQTSFETCWSFDANGIYEREECEKNKSHTTSSHELNEKRKVKLAECFRFGYIFVENQQYTKRIKANYKPGDVIFYLSTNEFIFTLTRLFAVQNW